MNSRAHLMPPPGAVLLPELPPDPPVEPPLDPPLAPLPGDEPPEPGYTERLPPPVRPLSPSVPMGLLPPELPGVPGTGDVESLLPAAPQGQGQLHMPPAPAAPAPPAAPEPPELLELPEPPTPPAPPGVDSLVGAPSAPPVMPLPRVASDCAQLNEPPANNNADNSVLTQQRIFLWFRLLEFIGFMFSPRYVF